MGLEIFHPWRLIRSLHHVTVAWEPLEGRRGLTNGIDKIWINPDQLQVERRCAIAHETIHLQWGHTTGCRHRAESRVRVETARRLLPLEALLDALAWTQDWGEAADELWVTVEVLRDRIDHLTPAETEALTVKAREMGEIR